jgi:hypothetical protein
MYNLERLNLVNLSKTSPLNSYYIYLHRRKSDGKPFYVGKGKGYRAWATHGRSTHWKRISAKHGSGVEIVFDNLTENESFELEQTTLKELKYFGYALCNKTIGGEGLSGFKWSEAQMLNHPSKKNIGRKQPPQEIEKRANALRGKICSDVTKDKIRNGQLGIAVFSDIVKLLTGKRLLSYKKQGEILNINPALLSNNPESYRRFPAAAVKKSADKRRGKPAYNSGKEQKTTQGRNNPAADLSIYSFINKDGTKFIGTRYDLAEKFKLKLDELGKLFYKKCRKYSQGWSILKEQYDNTENKKSSQ